MSELARDAVWSDYVRRPSPQGRDAIIRHYVSLAKRVVDRLQITPWGCVSQEDLVSFAVIGLINAVDRFDPSRGIAFEAFAMPRIRGAVIDALRKLDWAPRTVRLDQAKLRKTYAHLEMLLGRLPTDQEVADELGVNLCELDEMLAQVAQGSVLSLDDLLEGMNGGAGAEPMSGELRPEQQEERQEARRRLTDAIERLGEREKLVVSLYYFHELTLKEIGKVLGVTEQRVSQLHAKAILQLSHKLVRHSELVLALAS